MYIHWLQSNKTWAQIQNIHNVLNTFVLTVKNTNKCNGYVFMQLICVISIIYYD